MYKKLRYIFFLVLCSVNVSLQGQEIPGDTSDYTDSFYFVVFNSGVISNDSVWTEPEQGDYYRINFKNTDIQLTKDAIRLVEGTNISPVSKDSLIKYGISNVSDLSLTFQNGVRNCWLKSSDIESKMIGDTLYILRIEISPAIVHYERNRVCENDPLPILPAYSEETGTVEYIAPDGLLIDSYTGKIIPEHQQPGKYTVLYNSYYCLEKYEDTITILPKPAFIIEKNRRICEGNSLEIAPQASDNVSFRWSTGELTRSISVSEAGKYTLLAENEFECKLTDTIQVELKTIEIEEIDYDLADADCYSPGSMHLKQLELTNGVLPYQFTFKNRVTGQITTDAALLREGDYLLTIEDAEGCFTTYKNLISVRKDCLTERPVFSPNTDGRDDDYYIPYEGEAVVYDRNGMERHRFKSPDYWDGRDKTGNPLPMGTYLIVVGKEVINITIIK